MSLADPPAISRREVARSGLCIGCGGCLAIAAPDGAAMAWDKQGFRKPAGPEPWLAAPDARLARTCPFSPTVANEDMIAEARFPQAAVADARIGRFQSAWVGHAEEGAFRTDGSSGGMVSWVAAELLRRGLIDGVAHVVPSDPENGSFFTYRISRTLQDLRGGAKSRYYPVDMAEVLREIRETPGRYAVIGVPCFIKAVHLLRAEDPILRDRIAFTLGLFCGHQKSARLVESFAWQLDTPMNEVTAVDYRLKDASRPANWYRAHLTLQDGSTRGQDWWHLADGDWGAGFFQNSACSYCDDVVAETADIAFGDAWLEPYSSDGRGTNVVIVRSPELHALLGEAIGDRRLLLEEVNRDFVEATQAAGLRHRREGLSWRLSWPKRGLKPIKRVPPLAGDQPLRRRAVYLLRWEIAGWSNRLFHASRVLRRPQLYLLWARLSLRLYQALTYSRGRLGALLDRLEKGSSR